MRIAPRIVPKQGDHLVADLHYMHARSLIADIRARKYTSMRIVVTDCLFAAEGEHAHGTRFDAVKGRVIDWNCAGDALPQDVRESYIRLNPNRTTCRSDFSRAVRLQTLHANVIPVDYAWRVFEYRRCIERAPFNGGLEYSDLNFVDKDNPDVLEAVLYQIIPTMVQIFRTACGGVFAQLFDRVDGAHNKLRAFDERKIELLFAARTHAGPSHLEISASHIKTASGAQPTVYIANSKDDTSWGLADNRLKSKTCAQYAALVKRLLRLSVERFQLSTTVARLRAHCLDVREPPRLP